MARSKRRLTSFDAVPASKPERDPSDLRAVMPERLAQDGLESPAIALQRRVEKAYRQSEQRWSARRTLLFIVTVCGAFWAAAAMILLSLG